MVDRSKYTKLDITELEIMWRGASLDVLGAGRPLRRVTAEIAEYVGSGDELTEPDWDSVPLTEDGRVDGRELARRKRQAGQ